MMLTARDPEVLPMTVATAVALPQEMARAMVKRTLGPGTRMMMKAVIANSTKWWGKTITELTKR